MVHYTHMHSPEIVSIAHKLHTQINVHVAEYHQHEAWHSSLSCCMCCVMRAFTVKYPTILMCLHTCVQHGLISSQLPFM